MLEPLSITARPVVRCRLKELRTMYNMGLRELRARSDVGIDTISRIEHWGHNPTMETKRKLAKALGLKIRDIWPDEDDWDLG